MLSLTSTVLRQSLLRSVRASANQLVILSSRSISKNYDQRILLEPEELEYRPDDSRFLKGPSWADEPYIKPTDDEMIELTRIKLEREISMSRKEPADTNAEPFNQVFEGVDDGGRFTATERIPDLEARWPWVERLLAKKYLSEPIRADSVLIPPMPKSPPELPYFIQRTRSRLYPLYRKYEVEGRDHSRYWRNRWDGLFNKYHTDILENLFDIKWENNETIVTITEIAKVQGDVWEFEKDAREFLEQNTELKKGERILTSVNEVRGVVQFKGDHITLMYQFLKEKGF